MSATVARLAAPSGNRDNDYFQPTCAPCDWKGAMHSNRTTEGRSLAQRDVDDHNHVHHPRPLQEVLDEHCAQVRAQREAAVR